MTATDCDLDCDSLLLWLWHWLKPEIVTTPEAPRSPHSCLLLLLRSRMIWKNGFDWQANRIAFGMTNYLAFTVSCSSLANWLCLWLWLWLFVSPKKWKLLPSYFLFCLIIDWARLSLFTVIRNPQQQQLRPSSLTFPHASSPSLSNDFCVIIPAHRISRPPFYPKIPFFVSAYDAIAVLSQLGVIRGPKREWEWEWTADGWWVRSWERA